MFGTAGIPSAGPGASRGRQRVLACLSAALVVTALGVVTTPPANAAGSASLTALGSAYTQDFDTLAVSGTSSEVPVGWAFQEGGVNANALYAAGNGSGTAGDTYSFGPTGQPDRAFGALRSASLLPVLGAQFTNDTGATIETLEVAYTGEQWRYGATTARPPDRLDFQLSTDATGLDSGTWTDHDGLDFTSPVNSGVTGPLDGNAPGNRSVLTATITGLSVPDGASFWVRWTDLDVTGADDGLAVDDLSVTALAAPATSASLTALGSAYTQGFDTLAVSGTSSEVPVGWAFEEGGTSANALYSAGDGSGTAGDTYSFGATGQPDRAFGALRSASLLPVLGAQFTNDTGATIERLDVSYAGEQWRYGASTVRQDRLDFQLSTDATGLGTGTWTDHDSLDFTSPATPGVAGPLDGNAPGNRSVLTATVTGLSVPDGASFWVRWTDLDVSGADDGLALDDFSVTGGSSGGGEDQAPTVVETVPADAGTHGSTADLGVTFSEAVQVSLPGFSLTCGGSPVTVTWSGGPVTYAIDPESSLPAGQCTLTVPGAQVSDLDSSDPPDTMPADHVVTFTVLDECSAAYTPPPAVQGSGETGPLAGSTVTTQGVVVGDYEGTSSLRGFYVQDAAGDGNQETSDGIFVFDPAAEDRVSLGDVVRITGTAAEAQGQSQVSMTSLVVCGTGAVAPTDVTLPVPSDGFLERYEGMLVSMPQTLSVTESYQLGRFGQVVVSSGGRLQQPTGVAAPGAPALAVAAANARNRLLVDDATQVQNPDPILFGRGGDPLSAANTLRGGDTVTGMVGVMTYTWAGNAASPNAYRLRPVNALGGGVPDFVPANQRPPTPPAPNQRVRVMTMNVLNYFNTFDGCTLVGGEPSDCRGADSAAELDRQAAKIVSAIVGSGADVVGLVEIENDGYGASSAVNDLVDRLDVATAPGTYAFVDVDAATGQVNALGTDAVKVGLVYKPARVHPVGTTAVLNGVDFVNAGDGSPRNRPALAQAFDTPYGATFVVNVNHLKSKGSACDVPDAGDGQGDCSAVRTTAAGLLVDWLAGDPTGTGDPDVLITGDLNAYTMEDPVTAITAAGYADVVGATSGTDAYSYVFDGQWGSLDHALAAPSLEEQVTRVDQWHVNADEPSVLDYNTNFKSPGQVNDLYAPDRFRSSDHDPIVVDLDLAGRPDAQISTARTAGYVGNDIYNATGQSQTRTRDVRRGGAGSFFVRVFNDGHEASTFRLRGSTPARASTVRYFVGTRDITRAMRSSAGFATTLQPGAFKLVRVRIQVSSSAVLGSRKPALVTATWSGSGIRRVDAVKAVAKVVR